MSTHRAKSCVAYLRVSTARQGASGLGLEAQRATVQAYAAANGYVIVAEFVEVESGKRADRPQLAAALAACRLFGNAVLVIAKLDRLSRSVAAISALMEAGSEFRICDLPHASRLTIHLMAAMAEYEASAISERTKAALAAAKARGVKLGNPNGAVHFRCRQAEACAASVAASRANAAARAAAVSPILDQLSESGIRSATKVARELNNRGVPAPSGGVWYAEQVRRTQALLSPASAA